MTKNRKSPGVPQEPDPAYKFIEGGPYHGLAYTRAPRKYLQSIADSGAPGHEIAAAELRRRGSKRSNEVDITHHATDRASLTMLDIYHSTQDENEGICTWLFRMAENAVRYGKAAEDNTFAYEGARWVFDMTSSRPRLITVMRTRPTYNRQRRKRHGRKRR